MGSLFERGHNVISGGGWRTHKQRDARYNRKRYGTDEAKAQDIITALTPLSDPNRPTG